MKIKTINDELVQVEDRLQNLLDSSDTKFNPKVTYTIVKNKTAISQALKPFKETREKINRKYSDNGVSVNLPKSDPRFWAWLAELDEVTRIDVEVDIRMMKLADLGDVDISPKEMAALEIMLEDVGDEDKGEDKAKK